MEDEYKGKLDLNGGAYVDCGDGREVERVVQWKWVKMERRRAL